MPPGALILLQPSSFLRFQYLPPALFRARFPVGGRLARAVGQEPGAAWTDDIAQPAIGRIRWLARAWLALAAALPLRYRLLGGSRTNRCQQDHDGNRQSSHELSVSGHRIEPDSQQERPARAHRVGPERAPLRPRRPERQPQRQGFGGRKIGRMTNHDQELATTCAAGGGSAGGDDADARLVRRPRATVAPRRTFMRSLPKERPFENRWSVAEMQASTNPAPGICVPSGGAASALPVASHQLVVIGDAAPEAS